MRIWRHVVVGIFCILLLFLVGCQSELAWDAAGWTAMGVVTTSDGQGLEGVQFTFGDKEVAVSDSHGNWMRIGMGAGTTVTPAKQGWKFTPASATLNATASSAGFTASPAPPGKPAVSLDSAYANYELLGSGLDWEYAYNWGVVVSNTGDGDGRVRVWADMWPATGPPQRQPIVPDQTLAAGRKLDKSGTAEPAIADKLDHVTFILEQFNNAKWTEVGRTSCNPF